MYSHENKFYGIRSVADSEDKNRTELKMAEARLQKTCKTKKPSKKAKVVTKKEEEQEMDSIGNMWET